MKCIIPLIAVAFCFSIVYLNNADAVCCFPYTYDGYIDSDTGYFTGPSELMNDSYRWEPFGNATYLFEFLDENQNVIFRKNETVTNKLPIQGGFIIPPGLSLPFNVVIEDKEISKKIKSYRFDGTIDLGYFKWKPADLVVTNGNLELVKTVSDYNKWAVHGTIENTYSKKTSHVYVLASLRQGSAVVGTAGYSLEDSQPLELEGFEKKDFTLYATIPKKFKPDNTELYAESDESSMMHPQYVPIIPKDLTSNEIRFNGKSQAEFPLVVNVTNISRNDLDFDLILQIKKGPSLDYISTNDPRSKVEHIEIIPSSVRAQSQSTLHYTWTPFSNGVYFYEMYFWKKTDPIPLSDPYVGTFLEPNMLVYESNSPWPSPLKQFEGGVLSQNVKCNKNMIPAIKNNTEQPLCVKSDTMKKLTKRNLVYAPTQELRDARSCNSKQYIPDMTCFAEAFDKCEQATIQHKIYSVEGDPVTTTASIVKSNLSECNIHVYYDSKDRFGMMGKYESICHNLKPETKNIWIIDGCENNKNSFTLDLIKSD